MLGRWSVLYTLVLFPQAFYKCKALLCKEVIDFLLQKHAQHLLSKGTLQL